MKKMIIVVLSIAFSLTACNKNNSKANRIKPGAINPATTPEAAKEKAEREKADKEKADKEKADKATAVGVDTTDGAQLAPDSKADVSTEVPPKDSTETTTAVSAKPGTGTAAQTTPKVTTPSSTTQQTSTTTQTSSAPTAVATTTPAAAATPPVMAAKDTATSALAVAGNAALFAYNSMNYIEAKMTTDEQKNRVLMTGILGSDQAKAVKLALYCFDQKSTKIKTNDVKTNLPVMFLFPKSEALVEIKKAKTSAEDASQESPGFVLGVCDGDENVYDPKALESQDNYEIKKIRSGESHLDYLTLDEKDRDYTDISVACSNESNVSQKLDRKQNDAKKVMNRVTLSQGSKMLFSRPAAFIEKNGKSFQDNRKLKQNLVLECE